MTIGSTTQWFLEDINPVALGRFENKPAKSCADALADRVDNGLTAPVRRDACIKLVHVSDVCLYIGVMVALRGCYF